MERPLTGKLQLAGRMAIRQCLKVAWNALKANKMRALLTMLGIIIGVASVIVMTAIGKGTEANVMEQIYALGTNVIFVSPGKGDDVIKTAIGSEARLLTTKDVDIIKEKCFLIKGVAPQISRSVTVRYEAKNTQTNLVGTTQDFLNVRNFSIETGRFFTEDETTARAAICVLGSKVAEKLFGKDDPAGKTIKISVGADPNNPGGNNAGIRLMVIGVLKSKGKTFGDDNDNQIITPINTVQHRLFNEKYISILYLEASGADTLKDAKAEVVSALLPLHDNNPKNLEIQSQDEILSSVGKMLGAFTLMLGSIAFVSLFVGGIGIMNIMLVSVTERTKEIGLRKAIGARKSDILTQFLIESLVLSLTGGLIGIFIGIGIAHLYTLATSSGTLGEMGMGKTFITPDSIFLSFSFSAMVGVFFGLYPARKAASLDPIEALRYE
jgi:putative ABC transport system permease protein